MNRQIHRSNKNNDYRALWMTAEDKLKAANDTIVRLQHRIRNLEHKLENEQVVTARMLRSGLSVEL